MGEDSWLTVFWPRTATYIQQEGHSRGTRIHIHKEQKRFLLTWEEPSLGPSGWADNRVRVCQKEATEGSPPQGLASTELCSLHSPTAFGFPSYLLVFITAQFISQDTTVFIYPDLMWLLVGPGGVSRQEFLGIPMVVSPLGTSISFHLSD